ncbi:MAG: leucine-rich repeat protein [Rikenellaceae bacterium]
MKKQLLYLPLLLLAATFNFSCEESEADVEIPVISVELNKSTLEIGVGETAKLTAVITPEDATNQATRWESANLEIATVSDEGLVMGIAEGEVIITVYSDESSLISDVCTVTVSTNSPGDEPGTGGEEGEIELTLAEIDAENLPEETIWVFTDATATSSDSFALLRSAIAASPNDITVKFKNLTSLVQSALEVSDGSLAKLVKIEAPSLKGIGISALKGCTGLSELLIPVATTIEAAGLGGCSALVSLDMPAIQSIGYGAFYGCNNLVELSVNESYYSFEDGVLYNSDKSLIHTYLPANTATTYVAPSSVIGVGVDAFYDCDKIEEITIENAYIVGDFSFSYCGKLRSVSLPLVETIGGKAFISCTSLETLEAPIVSTIGSDILYGCTSITEVNFPKAETIDYGAFAHCSSLESVSLPMIKTIGIDALYECPKLTSLTMGTESWVEDISTYLFGWDGDATNIDFTTGSANGTYEKDGYWVISATNVKIGPFKSITGADEYTESTSNEYTLATIPTNGALIDSDTWIITNNSTATSANFENLYLALKTAGRMISLEFPEIPNIPENAFNALTTVKSVSAPMALSIGEYAFDICTGLTDVSFPKVQSIGWQSFYECTSLTTLSFPELTSTEMGAFGKCSSLTTFLAPKLQNIAAYAFSECSVLSTVDFSSVLTIAEMAFMYDFKLEVVSLPKAMTIGGGAFGASYVKTISAPVATSIEKLAFSVCPYLESLTIATESTITSAVSTLFDNTDLSVVDLTTAANNGTTVDGTSWTLPDGAGSTFTVSGFKSITVEEEEITDPDATAEYTLATIPEDGSTIVGDTWVITDSGVVSNALFVRLQSALATAGRPIALELPNLTVIPANGFTTACIYLTSLKAASATTILTDSFANAISLQQLELPSLTTAAALAFNNCGNLARLTMATTSTMETIETFTFYPLDTEQVDFTTGVNNGTSVSGNVWTVGTKSFTFKSITVQ